MADPTGPSPLAYWLEEALTSWILPLAALAIAVIAGLLSFAGVLSEQATGAVVVVAAPFAAAFFMLRPLGEGGHSSLARGLVAAAALATLVLTAWPALSAVAPGEPLFRGELAREGDAMALPDGFSGKARLLVAGPLRQGGEPQVSFGISGAAEPVDGKLERTFSTARVGRSGRARVAHDHTADWFEASIPPGTRELKLTRLNGQLAGPLLVAGYRDLLPHGLLLALCAAALLLAAAADARFGLKGNTAVASGMSLSFGLLVAFNATPSGAVGPAVGGVVLGAIVGSLAGWIAELVMRRLVRPEQRLAAKKKRPGAEAA
ncbi:hypothetical protein [Anaeromyxobacter paludicola]|uniref:Uncharacterized protein n=1 Tax=Anaeromyxobacter paludicola TaxID=2918171 RepID=A0ABM7XG56_9BACT|nr:hypothetical protein [Anaeromyxobacter paludicola]BDG10805.1 hypothetical protein AMPC_39180 [Anaeromyxobacter paludicola]